MPIRPSKTNTESQSSFIHGSKALTAKEAAKKVYSIAHVIIARALYRAVKLREVGACLKQKIDFWVALMVNESEKPKGKTKSENIGVAEGKNVEK
jgi:hypothetical protein